MLCISVRYKTKALYAYRWLKITYLHKFDYKKVYSKQFKGKQILVYWNFIVKLRNKFKWYI